MVQANSDRDYLYEYDLDKLRNMLKGKKEYIAIFSSIKRARDAASSHVDLITAEESLDYALSEAELAQPLTSDQPQDRRQARISAALFAEAIILYARAANQNDGRSALAFQKGWPAPLREAHLRILNVRRKAIAHFGDIGGKWVDETFTFRVLPGSHVATHLHSKRTNYLHGSINDLKVVLDNALSSVNSIAEQAGNDVIEGINSKIDTDLNLQNMMEQCYYEHKPLPFKVTLSPP